MVVTFTRTTDGSCCCLPDTGTGTGTIPTQTNECCPGVIFPGIMCVRVEVFNSTCTFLNYTGVLGPEPLPEFRPWNVCVPIEVANISPTYNGDGQARPFFGIHLWCEFFPGETGTGTGTNSAWQWSLDYFLGDSRASFPCDETPTTHRVTFSRDPPSVYSCDPLCLSTRFFGFHNDLPGYFPCVDASPDMEIIITIYDCDAGDCTQTGTGTGTASAWYCWTNILTMERVCSQTSPGADWDQIAGPFASCGDCLTGCMGASGCV